MHASDLVHLGSETTGTVVPMGGPPVGAAALDAELRDDVIAELNRAHACAGLALYCDIGEILLGRLFGGDLGNLARVGRRHHTLAAIQKDDRLNFPRSYLWYALNLLPQLRDLGQDLGRSLPMSHHRALMHVRNLPAKRMLAQRVCEEGWSKRDLTTAIRAWRKTEAARGATRRRGRPPSALRVVKNARVTKEIAYFGAEDDLVPPTAPASGVPDIDDVIARARGTHGGALKRIMELVAEASRLAAACHPYTTHVPIAGRAAFAIRVTEMQESLNRLDEFADDLAAAIAPEDTASDAKE